MKEFIKNVWYYWRKGVSLKRSIYLAKITLKQEMTMSNALTTLTNTLATKLGMGDTGAELMTTLKNTAFKGNATNDQFMALMIVANQYGLNPWTREIYAFPDQNNGIVPVVGVDGWSRIINDHPQFDGMDFEQTDSSCTCIIYRKDRSHPIKATEYMSECKRNTKPWQSHPMRMLRHKALIQCSRLAFGYTGIYDLDEAEVITEVEINPRGKAAASVHKAQQAMTPNVIDPMQEQKREVMIMNLEQVASLQGLVAYGEAFMAMTKEDRVLLGTAEHERMKGLAIARDAEIANPPAQDPNYAEAKVVTPEVDSFVAEMESAENV